MNLSDSWDTSKLTTVLELFNGRLQQDPDFPFADFEGEVYSYARLNTESTRLAHGLQALGVKHGDTVTSLLDNGPTPVVLMFAAIKLGAIHVPINTAFKGEFLRHQIHDSNASVLVAETDYAERVIDIEDGITDATALLYRGERPSAKAARLQVDKIEDHMPDNTAAIETDVKPQDVAMLVYTGGTTGPSKGCMISHNYACNLARLCVQTAEITADDVIWTPLPNFHFNLLASTIFASMLVGCKIAIYRKFSVSNFWPEIKRTGATIASMMGAMLPLILQMDETQEMKDCHGQLRVAGGAPLPKSISDGWKERFGVQHAVSAAYGLTEACLITSIPCSEAQPDGASGKRNDSFDVMIIDDDGNPLPNGESGEIVVRPLKPHVMFNGYWKRPGDTYELMENMWFHTGDIGKFDDDGFFYFVDRKKDYMRRRGENISSYEMESVYRTHPDIEDVAVHAVLSEFTEDDVKLTAVLRQGATVTLEEMCKWSIDQFPYFAVPRYYEFREQVPRNPLGRILKYELRDEGVTPTTLDMEKSGIKFEKR